MISVLLLICPDISLNDQIFHFKHGRILPHGKISFTVMSACDDIDRGAAMKKAINMSAGQITDVISPHLITYTQEC